MLMKLRLFAETLTKFILASVKEVTGTTQVDRIKLAYRFSIWFIEVYDD